jgi:peptidyl-prolyl cis-trans isomerase D
MLDAIRERSKGPLAKIILAAITIPFALFGIDTYMQNAGSNVAIAKVGGDTVTAQEYGNALQNLRNKLQSEGKTDPAVLDNPAVKQSVLDRLISDRLLNKEVKDANFLITDEQLARYITGLPEFSQDGKFSQELYDQILAQNRMTPSQFESSMRMDLRIQQAREGLAALAFLPEAVAEQTLKVEHQSREVSVAEIKTTDYLPEVKIDPAQVKAYYEKNKDKFHVPEQVKLEFVLMSANTLIPGTQVSEDETKKFYADNAEKFQGDEQRRASHILIGFGANPTPQAKQQAREKAEKVLAEVKKGSSFEELAKKYSQDPGSAEKGGDLGMFGRGAMVKPFEDAVFSMAPGATSDLVESEFGYHIIKLTEIKGAAETYDSVKPKIRAELMYQKALAKFSEESENFSNMVYEQSTSLEPVAKAYNLQVQKTGWLSREDGAKFFKNDKLMDRIFSEEVLKERRNTEAIEAAPNSLLSARVVDYKPAAPRSFDEVKTGIEDYLKLEQASKLAVQKGESVLANLKSGKEQALDWIPPVVVDRKNAQGLSNLAMEQAFRIDTAKLPAYAGIVNTNKGYMLVKVGRVDRNLQSDEKEKSTAEIELRSALASEYVAAYLNSLKAKNEITINTRLMESNPNN